MWTSREAPHQRPDAQLQDSRAARGQRVRRRGAQVRAHAAADHGRGESEPHLLKVSTEFRGNLKRVETALSFLHRL